MRVRVKLLTGLAALALAIPAAASADSLVNLSGNGVQVNPAVCANVLSTGGCTSSATGTVTPTGTTGGNSLVNVSGNAVQVNPAVCANVASNNTCSAAAGGTVTPTVTTPTTTGGVLGTATTGGPLVNLTGNAVQVNPAVCANILATSQCTSTTTGGGGTGGGVLGASTDTPFASVLGASVGGGSLPKTGSLGWMALVISLIGSVATGALVSRLKLTVS